MSPSAYEHHRLRCLAAAEAWERAAETARQAGDLALARDCNENATRNRWLAEPDPALAALFDEAAKADELWLPAPGDLVRVKGLPDSPTNRGWVRGVASSGPEPVRHMVFVETSSGRVVPIDLDRLEPLKEEAK